jgi:hypothetical protein
MPKSTHGEPVGACAEPAEAYERLWFDRLTTNGCFYAYLIAGLINMRLAHSTLPYTIKPSLPKLRNPSTGLPESRDAIKSTSNSSTQSVVSS